MYNLDGTGIVWYELNQCWGHNYTVYLLTEPRIMDLEVSKMEIGKVALL